jgi:excinuclease ABC subunit A
MEDKIIIKGARTHNLKNVSVEMPRGKMIVFTGLSGSGKSSLAFDTIFAEGQRKYVESLSAYARQFLRQMQKPDVDEITGLSPAISIDQKSRSNNPRSTVATITEIYDYLRVLYARIGHPHCPNCGREVRKLTNEEILERVLEMVEAASKKGGSEKPARTGKLTANVSKAVIRISSPLVVGRKGEYYQML